MKAREFISKLDDAKIIAAIAAAERKTTGEIRLYISHRAHADSLAYARKRLRHLGMMKTRHRNAVLLYIAPKARQFAIVGDNAVHEKCGDAFWQEVTADLTAHLREGDLTAALVHAITKIGGLLAAHFPSDSAKTAEELPGPVIR